MISIEVHRIIMKTDTRLIFLSGISFLLFQISVIIAELLNTKYLHLQAIDI